MKLTNNEFYFDYNASAPLVSPVQEVLTKGAFSFANPHSPHKLAKDVKKQIRLIKNEILEIFALNEDEFDLIFHSGATEGVNNCLKGFAFYHYKKGSHFVYSGTDHSCVVNQSQQLEILNCKSHCLTVDSDGKLDEKNLETILIESGKNPILLNLTVVNNETGLLTTLDQYVRLKERWPNLFIHLDCAQIVGKIRHWFNVSSKVDAMTFSAHKFGGLKGVGFTFLNKKFPFEPIILGGGQQDGFRSGTENLLGMKSTLEALKFQFSKHDKLSSEARDLLEKELEVEFGSKIKILNKSCVRALNTSCFTFDGVKASDVARKLSELGIYVGTGAACSSGFDTPSRVLLALGLNSSQAKSALRFSFSPYEDVKNIEVCLSKIFDVLKNV